MMDPQIHRQHGDRISLLSFFQNKESGLNTKRELPVTENPAARTSFSDKCSEYLAFRHVFRGFINVSGNFCLLPGEGILLLSTLLRGF
jgi:hypothetical protein